jgi:cardiolipin synthase
MLTLPNVITLARLCAVPLSVWLMLQGRFMAAFWLFVAAGVSDALDGWLARRMGSNSAVGALLDPVADKALLVSVVGGVLALYVLGQPPKIAPLFVSKANTVAQICLAALALGLAGWGIQASLLLDVAIAVVAASTLASGAAYVLRWGQAAS